MMDYRGFKNIPGRVYVKYTLVNLPGIALLIVILILAGKWISIPAWLSWTVIGLSIAKDVILFPFVWSAYDSEDPGRMRSLIGQRGIALEPLAPEGYIRVQGELWKAGTVNG
ncbi:NfeD family protein, partial [candidate division KSB1 bacterium]